MSVFDPPVVAGAELLDEAPLDEEAVDEELELDPHAASPKIAATATAAPLMVRLKINFFSFTLVSPGVSADRGAYVLISCKRFVRSAFALGRQPVPESEVRVDEAPARQRLLELHSQLPDVHVDGPIADPHLAAPDEAEQLVARHDPVGAPCELGQQAELTDREHQRPSGRARQVLVRQDLERPDLEHLMGRGHAP
jgi:hypothetical protein